MTELGPRARAVLAAVRATDRPSADARVRVASQLAARLPIAAAATAALAAAGSTASAATGLAAKALLLSALVGASSFAAGYFVGRSEARLRTTQPSVASEPAPQGSQSPDPPAPPTTAATAVPEAPSPEPTAVAPIASTASARPAAPAVSSAEPADAPAGTAKQTGSLAEETALLGAARAALGQGDAQEALARLDEMGERHPAGALREERMATRVMALCAAGRTDEARAEAQRFLQETPHSLQAARVRASCAGVKP